MKKLLLLLSLIAVMVTGTLLLAACETPQTPNSITADAAKLIAVTDLGTDLQKANFKGITTKEKDGVSFYDVEFLLNGIKYEYRINSVTSAIAKIEINDQTVAVAGKPLLPTAPGAAERYISREEAQAAAFADAKVESAADVTMLEVGLDYDNGIYLYEVEFRKTATAEMFEYEIKADKAAGDAIYKKEVNDINIVEPEPPNPSDSYIGAAQAKQIAFANAGITEPEAMLLKVQFEVDNGVHIYEIEFMVNAIEYDYDINATTGAIISKEVGGAAAIPPTTPPSGNYIGIDAAKTAALVHAGFTAEQVTQLTAKLEIERGIYIYEVEFAANGYEYEYEINAFTAAIVAVDKELD